MKITFNPSTVAALTSPPDNKDITFDLRGHNIFARGVKFQGTDTNTWRDIKINNVSIGSNVLDLRNGSNTTLTNTNGVVTINSTWRPVVDNLTSNSTTSSLSANQGRVLAGLINSKSDSDHNHDGRYLRLSGQDTMLGNLYLHSHGTSYIGKGLGDKSGADFTEANIVIRSWWGISFKSSDNVVRTYIDTRTGNIGTKGVLNAVGAVIQGRVYNGGNDEGIIIKPSPNGYAGLILGTHDGERSIFYFVKNKPFWRYSHGSDNLDIIHPKKSGTIALTSDIPLSLKNPYALTISLNGTSQGPYDGSAAKNINITPGSIGAAVSNHSHDYLVVNTADDKSFNSAYHNFQVLYAGGNNGIAGRPSGVDAFGLIRLRAASGWSGQMLLANGGSLYIRSSEDAKMTSTLAWKTILDSSNYSGILDSRYYTESEVNSLLDAKLNRQNLSYGTWNPRGYNLAADYKYNGGDLSISENSNKIFVSIDGSFWQNEGRYRVLDTSDVASLKSDLTVHQYLSATDTTWWPLIWGGSAHANTSNSTGIVYKSHDKLSWQTSTQTLYATNIRTDNIRHLSIGGGIYWNPYVESATDGSDAASITLVRSGVAGGTTLVFSQMDGANDTIQFQTNTAAKLYHNSYPILTTQNTYVSNNKGYIYGTEITQVNNSDTVDGWHKDAINRTLYITSTTPGLSSYWAKLWEMNLNNQHNDVTITFLAAASYYPSYFAIFSVYLRQNGFDTSKDIRARLVELIGNIAVGDTELRLYVNNTTGNCQLWGNVKRQYGTLNLSVLKKAWRTDTDSSNIGTFFSINFSSVQSLPGDGWYKVGVTQQDVVGTFNPSSHTHTWTSITDKLVAGNEFNIVNAGFNAEMWFNYAPINDISKTATVSSYYFGNGHKGLAPVCASGFIINGGTSQQLLRADGGVATFNWSGQSGQPTWLWGGNSQHSYYVYNPSNFRVAYAASAGNADTLDGEHASSFVRAGHYESADLNSLDPYSFIKSVNSNVAGTSPNGNTGWYNVIQLVHRNGASDGPNYIGQIALGMTTNTNDMFFRGKRTDPWKTVIHSGNYTKFINNYYWANVKISTSSSTTTSPTVHTLIATRVCAGHDPKIDNSISCSNWFRSSGNTGWYNTTYMGGWYMSDTSWIRAYNNVGIYTGGNVKSSGFHHVNHDNDDAVLLAGGNYKTLNSIYGGDSNHPVFLGYLDLYHGNDGTISSFFSCLGYSVPFTYTRGGNYCRINIPDTTHQVFYIKAATASVNYSGGGMDTLVGFHSGAGAWWLHCYASSANEVRVKGFRQDSTRNDSWWGGNPLLSANDGANKITVCIFGYVGFK